MKKASKWIAWVFLVLLLAGGIAAIVVLTNGGKTDFKDFLLSRDSVLITESKSEMRLRPGEKHAFGVKYVMASGEAAKDYTVTVTPNPDVDYSVYIDGAKCAWRKLGDFTSFFVSERTDSGFTFMIPEDFSLWRFMRSCFLSQTVVIPELPSSDVLLFRLTVSSYDGSAAYVVDFSVRDDAAAEKGEEDEEKEAHAITVGGTPGGTTWFSYVCPETAKAGETVHFVVEPLNYSPYSAISSVVVRAASGAVVELIPSSDGMAFIMPDEDVEIVVTLSHR